MIECLQSRVLFATSLSSGVLTITGTAGNDSIQFARRSNGFSVLENYGQGIVQTNWTFANVQRVVVNSGDGNDTVILGRVIVDAILNGGAGDDTLSAGGGEDTIYGNSGNDNMFGGDSRDFLDGGLGADTMLGGGSRDVVDFSYRTADVVISLGIVANDGEVGENDMVATDLEVVVAGSGNDHISTDSGRAVSLYGGVGNDTLVGGSGNDFLDGQAGRDSLSGQAGIDNFFAQDGEIDTISGGSGSDSGVFDGSDIRSELP